MRPTYTLAPDDARKLTIHPAANLFPMMTAEEQAELRKDVEAAGLLEPIVLTSNRSEVIDGRNRLQVCLDAGVAPRFVDWEQEGSDPVAWVLSVNLRRRHLTESQRAMIAVEAKNLIQRQRMEATGTSTPQAAAGALGLQAQENGTAPVGGPKDGEGRRARDVAAKALGVGGRTVDNAAAVKKADPVLAEQVKAGEITVNAARERVKLGPIWNEVFAGTIPAPAPGTEPKPLHPSAATVARRLERDAPDLAQEVLRGNLALYAAKKMLDEREGKPTNADHRRAAEGSKPKTAPKATDTRHPRIVEDEQHALSILHNVGHFAASLLKLDEEAVRSAAAKKPADVKALMALAALLNA